MKAKPGKSRVVVLLGAAVALAAMMFIGAPATTHAAGKDKKSAARAITKAPTKTSAKAPATAARAKSPAKSKPVAERSVPAPAPATTTTNRDDATTGDAEGAATTTAGGKTLRTKTYTFGAMDVEGKLKTPQLLYFLNRVKLELDMSAPDKRSFMKELADSADDKNL